MEAPYGAFFLPDINTIMELEVYYGSGDVVHNTCVNSSIWPLEQETEKVITFELNDYPLTKKFTTLWQKMWDNAITQDGGRYFSQEQSVCTGVSEESILESRRHHNNLIRQLQRLRKAPKIKGQPPITFDTPDSLIVNELDPYDRCEDKFNKGHHHFETQATIWQNSHIIKNVDMDYYFKIRNILSELNETCHYNEQKIYSVIVPNHRTTLKYTYLSHDRKPNYLRAFNFETELTDQDYEHFCYQNNESNVLWLDFATVGKSLTEVAFTNDLDLLHSKGITQQTMCRPWVRYEWTPSNPIVLEKYNEWIVNNNVKDYYDLSLPVMKPGLHPLGKCISHDFKSPKEFNDFIKDTPKIVGAKLV